MMVESMALVLVREVVFRYWVRRHCNKGVHSLASSIISLQSKFFRCEELLYSKVQLKLSEQSVYISFLNISLTH